MLRIEENASLLRHNTFGIDCTAARVVHVASGDDVVELAASGLLQGKHVVIGGGSNMVLPDRYDGTAIVMESKGVKVLCDDGEWVEVEVAAGEIWDAFVKHSVGLGWYGLENLVAIPGTVGAAVVGNIGAYGVEAGEMVKSVKAYDVERREWEELSREECCFAYRDSVFKRAKSGKSIVVSAVFRLGRSYEAKVKYAAVEDIVRRLGHELTAEEMMAEIEAVRWAKLPKPEETGSAGSFFKNPVVGEAQYEKLKGDNPELVAYKVEEGYKLAAGWLIEHAGWKGRSVGRCGVYEKQALVLVNRGGCSGSEVRNLAEAIEADIKVKYGVELTPEAIMVE